MSAEVDTWVRGFRQGDAGGRDGARGGLPFLDARAESNQPVTTHERVPLTPSRTWALLAEGNRRFVAEETAHPRQDGLRRERVARTPAPVAVVVGCMDSRAPVELLFDLGVGDVFAIRTPGAVLTPNTVGGVALAAELPTVHLIVVMGHDDCKAVEAAVAVASGGVAAAPSAEVAGLAHTLAPAVAHAGGAGASTDEVAAAQVGLTLDAVRGIAVVQRRLGDATLGVLSARLNVGTGAVEVLASEGLNA